MKDLNHFIAYLFLFDNLITYDHILIFESKVSKGLNLLCFILIFIQ